VRLPRYCTRLPNEVLPSQRLRYRVPSHLLLAHYTCYYYDIQPVDDLRVTSYCDSSSLFKAEEEFRDRDVDSSSWYLKLDHDIRTLSEVRDKLPFKLVSLHARIQSPRRQTCVYLTRPEQLDVLADHRAIAVLNDLLAAGQPT
jgi:hypothetical protein